MQQTIFDILPEAVERKQSPSQLSFKRFIQFIETRDKQEKTLKTKLYDFILNFFSKHPEIARPMSVQSIGQYTELLDLLNASLLPILNDEQETFWALSMPASDTIFYGTPAFYRLMATKHENGMAATASPAEIDAYSDRLNQVKYALILERIYDIMPLLQEEIIYVQKDQSTGLSKYYSIYIDSRFVDVQKTSRQHEANAGDIQQQLKIVKSLCQIEGTISLSDFSFEGFSIITATDVTARYALHKMRSAIIRHTPENYEETYKQIVFLLKVLCGRQNIRFGLFPFLKLNNRLVALYKNYNHSITINLARSQKVTEQEFVECINDYAKNVKPVFSNGYTARENDSLFQQLFANAGIQSYALLPVYHSSELAGLLEVSAEVNEMLNEKLLAGLDAAMPILAQLMHNNQAEFKAGIDNVIKMNFTSIQPAVQWKFNEVAWKYLKSRFGKKKPAPLEKIRFENVYPLYGAIDIRNSTIERNDALFKDVQQYFSLVQETLHLVIEHTKHQDAKHLLMEAESLQTKTGSAISGNEEPAIVELMDQVRDFFQALTAESLNHAPAIEKYFEAVNPATGIIYEHRRALEKSMQMINSSISQYLELMQMEFQEAYPVYFEKFRTDGVEYDIYIGQSINPLLTYKQEYIDQFRIWQLTSMAAIAKMVHLSEPMMPVLLQTTQLIYVNANTIDISFRNDEKRFDVEGGYNIKYHIIKKRIDKVHVKETGERLTQPGKIAIVYSQEAHKEAYLLFISQLLKENIILPEIEQFELEELQGVTGLKALRVAVVL